MKADPVIAEVRRTREELCRRFQNDPRKYYDFLQQFAAVSHSARSSLYPEKSSVPESLREESEQ